VIAIRDARTADAVAIAAVHVAAWRNTYPGILPDDYLAKLSVSRQAIYYDRAIRAGSGVLVATASGAEVTRGGTTRIIGFSTFGAARRTQINGRVLGEGEIETLYVLDDWRDRGVGRGLLHTAAARLLDGGCRSAFVWVLRDNPSRWFYERLGGRPVAEAPVRVGGQAVTQTAFAWDPIEKLLTASTQES
jgi:ribosomal protein S18 acetylase RimI-like enzyme